MTETHAKKEYPLLDVLKLFMAVLVVLIHRPIASDGRIHFLLSGNTLLSVAVPFFFVASSFLFFRKLQTPDIQSRSVLIRFEKRLLILYLLYSAVYFPIDFLKTYFDTLSQMTLRTFAAFVLQYARHTVMNVSFVHLWYVYSLLLSVPVVFFLTRFVRNKWGVLGFALVEFIGIAAFHILAPAQAEHLPYVLDKTLRVGIPCVCGGYFAASSQDDAQDWLLAIPAWILLLGSSLLSYPNQTRIWEFTRLFFAIVTAYGLMRLCVRFPLTPQPVFPILRNYSTLIYFWHLFLSSEILSLVATYTGLSALETHGLMRFCVTLSFALLTATCILRLQKKKFFRFLRYLY